MRVMHVTASFPPYGYGGTEFYVSDLIREQSRRHKVSVAYRRRHSSDLELHSRQETGYTVYELNFARGKPEAFAQKGQELFSKVLDKAKPDLIHFHSFLELPHSLIDAANAAGIPSVYTPHDLSLLCPSISLVRDTNALCSGHVSGLECFDCHTSHQGLSAVEKAKRLALLNTYRGYQKKGVESLQKLDAVLCPTEFAAKKISEFGVSRERLLAVPFGRTLHPRLRFKSVGGVLRFGFIGDLAPFKGIELLIEAFRMLKQAPAELDVYGHGDPDYEARLVDLAGNAPINFLGIFERTYIDRIFERIDVLVLPTLAQETVSLVLLESIACGVPVLVPNAGGLPDIVKKHNAGLVFEFNDAESLAERMQEFTEEPHLVEQLSRSMLPVPSLEAHASDLDGIYSELARK